MRGSGCFPAFVQHSVFDPEKVESVLKYANINNMKYTFLYYSDRVHKEILSLPQALLAEFLAMKVIMETEGPALGMPYTKAMGDGLFEMRLSERDGIARVFYCTVKKTHIMVLHSFVKKTKKTPEQELKLAKKRLKEVISHG